jgi:hypothetical protein
LPFNNRGAVPSVDKATVLRKSHRWTAGAGHRVNGY